MGAVLVAAYESDPLIGNDPHQTESITVSGSHKTLVVWYNDGYATAVSRQEGT